MRAMMLLAVTALGCSSEVGGGPSNVYLLTGQEGDVWSGVPSPTSIQIELVDQTRRIAVGQATAPASEVTIKDPGVASGTIASFEATGMDPNGTTAVRGTTVPYLLYGLSGVSVPIFIGRTGGWSRPQSPLDQPHFRPVVTVAFHEYVIVAGGDAIAGRDAAVPDVYDIAMWSTLSRQPALPRAPKSMAVIGRLLLTVNADGASWLNLTNDFTTNPAAPEGLTYSEIAGGEAFELSDAVYIVGATRQTGDPTAKVLRLNKDATLQALSLTAPRLGAAAAVIGGNLVVTGGSAEAPGVEVLIKGQTAFTALPFPPDASTGHGLTAVEGSTAVLAASADAVTGAPTALRSFDASCTADCATNEIAALPLALRRTQVFALGASSVVVVGESEDGETHTLSVALSAAPPQIVEQPLRERRKWATALLLPNSQVGVVGGARPDTGEPVLSIESYVP